VLSPEPFFWLKYARNRGRGEGREDEEGGRRERNGGEVASLNLSLATPLHKSVTVHPNGNVQCCR